MCVWEKSVAWCCPVVLCTVVRHIEDTRWQGRVVRKVSSLCYHGLPLAVHKVERVVGSVPDSLIFPEELTRVLSVGASVMYSV